MTGATNKPARARSRRAKKSSRRSPASLRPIAWVKFLARGAKAKIHLLPVHDSPYPIAAELPLVPSSETQIEERLRCHLEALAKEEGPGNAMLQLRAGRSSHQICQLAEEIRASLIAVSTHGRTGLPHVFLGSVAEHMVRCARLPFLVVPPVTLPDKKTSTR